MSAIKNFFMAGLFLLSTSCMAQEDQQNAEKLNLKVSSPEQQNVYVMEDGGTLEAMSVPGEENRLELHVVRQVGDSTEHLVGTIEKDASLPIQVPLHTVAVADGERVEVGTLTLTRASENAIEGNIKIGEGQEERFSAHGQTGGQGQAGDQGDAPQEPTEVQPQGGATGEEVEGM